MWIRKNTQKFNCNHLHSICRNQISTQAFLHLRYDRTDCALMCSVDKDCKPNKGSSKHGDFKKAFLSRSVIGEGKILSF